MKTLSILVNAFTTSPWFGAILIWIASNGVIRAVKNPAWLFGGKDPALLLAGLVILSVYGIALIWRATMKEVR